MNVLFVSAEVAPWSKSGGLADVSSALPRALARQGARVTVVSPLYACVPAERLERVLTGLGVPLGGDRLHADLWSTREDEVEFLFLDPPGFFERPYLYGPPGGEYADNGFRFAFLARGALEAALGRGLPCDVVHGNDWHCGLLPLFLRRHLGASAVGSATTAFTIHNLGYQGLVPFEVTDVLDLGVEARDDLAGLGFFGRASYLKAGIRYADLLTTVSPTYAREIQTPALGFGLDAAVRARAEHVHGILNGIDASLWDPARDPAIAAPFDVEHLEGKAECKAALRRELGLAHDGAPLCAVVSRFAWQKGWDLFEPVADAIVAGLGIELVVLGSGEPRYEAFFRDLALRYPHRVVVRTGFDEPLAHRIEAGADLFLMPSRYEPCGLNQMYSLRYGTVPVVRGTGGLEDTVVDVDESPAEGTGFKFREESPTALLRAMERARRTFDDAARWREIQRRGMAEDFSWDRSARAYLEQYEAARRRG